MSGEGDKQCCSCVKIMTAWDEEEPFYEQGIFKRRYFVSNFGWAGDDIYNFHELAILDF